MVKPKNLYNYILLKENEFREGLASQFAPLSVVFVQMAQDGTLDDITISEHPTMFVKWDKNWTGKAGTIVRDGDNLYRSIHDITNVAHTQATNSAARIYKQAVHCLSLHRTL